MSEPHRSGITTQPEPMPETPDSGTSETIMPVRRLRRLVSQDPSLGDLILRAYLIRSHCG